MLDFIQNLELAGAGEILINSVDNDSVQKGYDINLLNLIKKKVRIPIIASGGAGCLEHLKEAREKTGIFAFAAGSIFVYHGKHKAVLISYPSQKVRDDLFGENENE